MSFPPSSKRRWWMWKPFPLLSRDEKGGYLSLDLWRIHGLAAADLRPAPPIALFNRDEQELLSFRVFRSAVYEDKAFEHLELDDARFAFRVFRNCLFRDSKLRDARFDGRDFENCRFERVRLDEARFNGSKLRHIEMSEVKTNCMSPDSDTILGGLTTTDFVNRFLENVSITKSDYSASRFLGCQAKQLTTDTSKLFSSLELLQTQE